MHGAWRSAEEWLSFRPKATSFELEKAQVEQMENQLRDQGVAARPGSGALGPSGIVTGAAGTANPHTGDGRAGAGQGQDDVLNNAAWHLYAPIYLLYYYLPANTLLVPAVESSSFDGCEALGGSMVGGLAMQALRSKGGGGLASKPQAAEAAAPVASEEQTEKAELKAELTGEGEETILDVSM